MQFFAKFKQILYMGFRATLNFRKFKVALNPVYRICLRWLEIVFIFPRLVLQILYQMQFGLSYQCEISHRHKLNIIESLHYNFFPENLLPWKPYNAFSCTPKSKAIVLLRELVGKIFLNYYLTCC